MPAVIQKTIRKRLLTFLTCLAILPLLFVGLFLSWNNYTVHRNQVKDLQRALTNQVAKNIAFFFHEQEHKILTYLKLYHPPDIPRNQLPLLLSRFLSSSKMPFHGDIFTEAAVLDKMGKEVARNSLLHFLTEDNLRDRSRSDEFLIPMRTGENYYGSVYFDQETGQPGMTISVPLRDLQSQAVSGVFVAELNLMSMRNLIEDTKIGKQGVAYVTNPQGRVVVHPNPSIILKKTHFQVPDKAAITAGLSGESAVVVPSKLGYHGIDLTVITEIPTSEAFKSLYHGLFIIGAIILLTLISAVTLGFILVRQFIIPLESLAVTARQISQGDFSHHIKFKETDEFGELANALNTMMSRLIKTIEAFKAEKNFVKNTIEALSHPFYVIDAKDYSVKLANSATGFGLLTGNEKCHQLTHNSDEPCSGKDHPCPIEEIRRTGKPAVMEHLHYQNGGGETCFEVNGYPIFDDNGDLAQIIEYNIDISSRIQLEEQLAQSQKLESIGRLASGVAHDFNNLLTPIIGYSEITLYRMKEEDPLKIRMKAIYDCARRATSLTRQLLAFSRNQVMKLEVIELNNLITNLIKMLKRLIGEDIEMKLMLHDLDGRIKADQGQIEQIIMNLAINSRDAMPSGGTLIMETNSIYLDEEYCRKHPDVSPGSYIVLIVTDNGEGMSPDVKSRIFDPFFTTKPQGKGTGLGLATVYGIVKQLQGQIFVYSEIDSGTTFKIYFPKIQETAKKKKKSAEESMPKGTESILVVDDEPSIRMLVIDTLTPLGYNVIEAEDGLDALQIIETTDEKFDLILTDVIMPKMSGHKLAEKILTNSPDTKILFMSGYTDTVIVDKGVLKPGILFINKPLIPSLLAAEIRRIFDKKT
ncbi:MAG: response regulator [Desulfobulbaceae bacterium]|nr:response regulator [Desulfobulbaceae bacterium]